MTVADAVLALQQHRPEVIAIGASAGAVDALNQLLPVLPDSLAAPVVIVVHIPPDRPSGLPGLFAAKSRLPVREAEDKCPIERGVYFAPPDYHLLIERGFTLALSNEPPVHFSRPAIDILFDSVADAFQRRGMGILLSGASADGAAGLRRIQTAGGLTWVQLPSSAAVATMPEAALAMSAHAVLTPEQMGQALAQWESRS